jgi:hypothetical protein
LKARVIASDTQLVEANARTDKAIFALGKSINKVAALAEASSG